MPIAANRDVQFEILQKNCFELQKQLQQSYVRIKELTEELDRIKKAYKIVV